MSLDPRPALPQELVDNVIDHLHNDVLTLRACALTSRHWLPTARYHIFHLISIWTDMDLTRFLHLLHHAPHIAPYIHILSLGEFPDTWAQDLLLLQQLLPNVNELIVNNFDFFDICDEMLDFFYNHFAGIKSLQLFGCFVENAKDFVDLLYAKPNLESILLQSFHFHEYPDSSTPVESRRALPQLKSISADFSFTIDPIIEKILIHGSFPCLHTLDLEPVMVLNDFKSVTALLKEVAPTLVNLSIPLRIETIQDTAFEQIQRLNTFSNIPHLRSLHLHRLELDKESTSGLLPLILSQLQPSSLNLQEILVECTCNIDVETFADFHHVQWTQIDQMFFDPHFGSVKILTFQMRTRSGPHASEVDAFLGDFRAQLPYLENRGVLNVVLVPGVIRRLQPEGVYTWYDYYCVIIWILTSFAPRRIFYPPI